MTTTITRRQRKKFESEKRTLKRSTRMATIARRQRGRCWFCGLKMFRDVTKEHLIAQSLGGGDTPQNLRAAHGQCNSAAGHLLLPDKLIMRSVASTLGPREMFIAAQRLRREQVRRAFTGDDEKGAVEYDPHTAPYGPPPLLWDASLYSA